MTKDITMPELEVEWLPTASLVPYARNAKIHTVDQIGHLKASIEAFGFNDPIGVYDAEGGTEIVEGHGRVLAAKELGLERVPVIRLDHMTDEERRAYTHAHNHINQETGDDLATLQADLDELADGIDLEALGFQTGSIDGDAEASGGYSSLVKGLIYEPSDVVPSVSELVLEDDAEELAEFVDGLEGLTDEERKVCILAAFRFNRFDYEKIADYYASASAQCKEAFERLKLVIVDDGSIENAAMDFVADIQGAWEDA